MDEHREKIYCLFLRHCLSCSNSRAMKMKSDEDSDIHGLDRERIYLVEPFCTKEGIRQAWMAGTRIPKFLKSLKEKSLPDLPAQFISFASSTLVRAMETAKFVSAGVMAAAPHYIMPEESIQILPYISEIWGEDQEFENRPDLPSGTHKTDALSDSQIGSGGTTTPYRVLRNIDLLMNYRFFPKMGLNFSIPVDLDKACSFRGVQRCALNLDDVESDFTKFRKKILKLLNPNTVTVIISHGWYMQDVIRSYIIKQNAYQGGMGSNDVLDNLQGMLVSFDLAGKENANIETIFMNHDIVPKSFQPLESVHKDAEIIENSIRDANHGFLDCKYCGDYLEQPFKICEDNESLFVKAPSISKTSSQFIKSPQPSTDEIFSIPVLKKPRRIYQTRTKTSPKSAPITQRKRSVSSKSSSPRSKKPTSPRKQSPVKRRTMSVPKAVKKSYSPRNSPRRKSSTASSPKRRYKSR